MRDSHSSKAGKDRVQAKVLLDALDDGDPDILADALEDGLSRGPAWRTHINAGLKQIGRSAEVSA